MKGSVLLITYSNCKRKGGQWCMLRAVSEIPYNKNIKGVNR